MVDMSLSPCNYLNISVYALIKSEFNISGDGLSRFKILVCIILLILLILHGGTYFTRCD